jgi:hypothetical protein
MTYDVRLTEAFQKWIKGLIRHLKPFFISSLAFGGPP